MVPTGKVGTPDTQVAGRDSGIKVTRTHFNVTTMRDELRLNIINISLLERSDHSQKAQRAFLDSGAF